jgi:hypothetical protein
MITSPVVVDMTSSVTCWLVRCLHDEKPTRQQAPCPPAYCSGRISDKCKSKRRAAKPRSRLSRVRRLQRTPARPGRWRCSHGTLTRSSHARLTLVSRSSHACALPAAVFPARSHAPVLLPCSPHRARRARSISRKLHLSAIGDAPLNGRDARSPWAEPQNSSIF